MVSCCLGYTAVVGPVKFSLLTWSLAGVADKVLRDQLNELTRLVFRLPEVESLLQGVVEVPPSARQEPGAAVAVFIKVHTPPTVHTHMLCPDVSQSDAFF